MKNTATRMGWPYRRNGKTVGTSGRMLPYFSLDYLRSAWALRTKRVDEPERPATPFSPPNRARWLIPAA